MYGNRVCLCSHTHTHTLMWVANVRCTQLVNKIINFIYFSRVNTKKKRINIKLNARSWVFAVFVIEIENLVSVHTNGIRNAAIWNDMSIQTKREKFNSDSVWMLSLYEEIKQKTHTQFFFSNQYSIKYQFCIISSQTDFDSFFVSRLSLLISS